jgi:hypothetical protein
MRLFRIPYSKKARGKYAMTNHYPRIRPGDKVCIKGWPPMPLEVVCIDKQLMVTLRSEYGMLKVGSMSLAPVESRVHRQSEQSSTAISIYMR